MTYHSPSLVPSRNGRVNRTAFIEGGIKTRKYKGGSASYLGLGAYHWALQRGSFTWGDIDAMLRYPTVQIGLRVINGPIFGHCGRWNITAQSTAVAEYIDTTLRHLWTQDMFKILRMISWGSMGGEVVWKEDDDGIIRYDFLDEMHLWDIAPLALDGRLCGLSCKTLQDQNGNRLRLGAPRYFWIANEPGCRALYGTSRLQGAFEPWMERCGKHGANDVRRLWFLKNVATGGQAWHPMGEIEVAPGVFRPNEEYVREVLEKAEAMAVYTWPNTTDDKGNRMWAFEPAKINGDGSQFLLYPKDLDNETLLGMGIMPEIIQMAEGGGGWSGRSIPVMQFLESENLIIHTIHRAADQHIIRPGVDVNFGKGAKYKVEPISLVPKEEHMAQDVAPETQQDKPRDPQFPERSSKPLPGQLPRSQQVGGMPL